MEEEGETFLPVTQGDTVIEENQGLPEPCPGGRQGGEGGGELTADWERKTHACTEGREADWMQEILNI